MELEMRLDDIDWAIIDRLQRNGRVGFRELGRLVGLSAPAVTARVHRLEEAEIITGYRAVVSPEALGLAVQAFVRMSVTGPPEMHDEFDRTAGAIPEIREVYRITGAETYLLRVLVPTVQDLERVLRPLWRFGDTVTGVVMSAPVGDRPIGKDVVG
jgi:Lrp/AsnC family leucine-responsive transcriptional regulator